MNRVPRTAVAMTLALLGAASGALHAQAAAAGVDTIAFAGPRGAYVWMKGTVVSPAHPVNGVVAHRLERARPGGRWEKVADVSSVPDGAQFFARLDSATRRAVVHALRQSSEAAAWEQIVSAPQARALSTILGNDEVRLALGIYGLDQAPRSGETWLYRVSDLAANGAATNPVVSNALSFPPAVHFDPVEVARSEESDSLTIAWWYVGKRGTRTKAIDIWRRAGRTGDFTLVDSAAVSTLAGDSLLARSEDRRVTPGAMYQYYAVPRDLFFNRGPASDTVTLYTAPLARVALPDSIEAHGVDTLGILLTWNLASTAPIRTIQVFRSRHQDSGYVQIAELPADAGRFVDAQVDPMQLYYYRLGMSGLRSAASPRSAAVFAFFRPALAPTPPLAVRADTVAAGFRVRWASSGDGQLSGYHVYRTDAPVDSLTDATPMQLISPLLAPTDSMMVDSSSVLGPSRQYTWAVRAVGPGGLESEYSNPAMASRTVVTPPPVPTRVSGYADADGIALAWHDMTGLDPLVTGYLVLRQADGATAWDTLTRRVLGRLENRYRDGTARSGVWRYTVVSVSLAGSHSAMSTPVEVRRTASPPPPPSGFRAGTDTAGVLLEWDPAADSTAIVRIYRYQGGAAPTRLTEVPAATLGYLDRSALAGRRYYYYLRLVAGGVEGPPGAERSVRR